jgi:hypothetical protein
MYSRWTRKELEDQITQKEMQVEFSVMDAKWIYSQAFREYLDIWKKYVDYHRDAEEAIISVTIHALTSYLRTTRLLNMLLRRKQPPQDQEEIEEVLAELEDRIDTIISEGFARIYSSSDESNDQDQS